MRVLAVVPLVLFVACQAPPAEFTDAQKAQIEAEVEQIMVELYDSYKRADPEPMMAYASEEMGLCVQRMNIRNCREMMDAYYASWTSEEEPRLERQEMDGEEIRVIAISPTVAFVVHTTQENRAVLSDGRVNRASFASSTVFVLTDDGWKMHSGQQAAWPIEDEGGGQQD